MTAKIFTFWNLQIPGTNLIKITHQHIESNDQIVSRIKEFLDKIKVGQTAKFTCFAGKGANYQTVSIEILPKSGMRSPALAPLSLEINNSDFDIDEQYFSLDSLGGDDVPTAYFEPTFVFNKEYLYQEFFVSGGTIKNIDVGGYYTTMSHKAYFRLPIDLHSSLLRYRVHTLMKVKMDQLASASRWMGGYCPIL